MAGSYGHVAPPNGAWSLGGENLGDAAETVEQLLWLVLRVIGHSRAVQLINDEFYPMCRRECPPDNAFTYVQACIGR